MFHLNDKKVTISDISSIVQNNISILCYPLANDKRVTAYKVFGYSSQHSRILKYLPILL